MNSEPPRVEPEITLSFQDRIEILFHELELAVRWDRPSILFAIYRSEAVREEVNARLKEMLASISQNVVMVRTNPQDQFDFLAQTTSLPDLAHTILVIDGFNWECSSAGVRVFQEFNQHRETFIDNNLRAIFWLFENEVSDFAANATECWILRHRVVDFIDLPQPAGIGEPHPAPAQPSGASSQSSSPLPDDPLSQVLDLKDASRINPAHASELLSRGILHWRQGDPLPALRYLQAAGEIARHLADPSLLAQCRDAVSLVHAGLQDIDAAVASYEAALALIPDSEFLWTSLGLLLARNERNEAAISAFQQAISCSPSGHHSWEGLGQVYLKMDLVENAISAFEKALRLSPASISAWVGLGQAFLASGNQERAVLPLSKVAELEPARVSAWLDLAAALVDLERDQEAFAAYRKGLEFNPEAHLLWEQLGRFHLQRHEFVESIAAFRKVITLRPGSGDARVRLAYALDQIGDYEASAIAYEECIPLFPDAETSFSIWNRLGDTYLHLKEYEKAIQAYERSRQVRQEFQPRVQDDSILELIQPQEAAALDEPGDLPESSREEGTPQPQEKAPPLVESIDLPGISQEERGPEMNEANAVFDSRTAQEWNALGNSHLKEGAYNEAISAYTRAIELSPGTSWAYIRNLAQVHYQKGKAKGRLTPGQVDDPEVWEGEDESDPTPLFCSETQPLPERGEPLPEGEAVIAESVQSAGAETPPPACPCQAGNQDRVADPAVLPESADSPQLQDRPAAVLPSGEEWKIPYRKAKTGASPQNSIDWNDLGNSLTRSRKYNDAIQAYKKAIEMNPRYGQPYNNLGLLYYHLGRYDVAVLLFRKSLDFLESSQDKAVAWNKLGDSYRRLGDYGNALTAYQRSSELSSPSSPFMVHARASLLETIVAS